MNLGYASGDPNSPLGAARSRASPISAVRNIRRAKSPSFTTPASCLRTRLSVGALALLRAVGSAIRTVTARIERGFADFAHIPYEDVSHRELCEFLDEFEDDYTPPCSRRQF
jgi:hypothetical protein